MIVCFALCWLPLQVLVVVTHLVYQTDDEPAFDIAYAVLLLVALMSPLTTAIIARPITMVAIIRTGSAQPRPMAIPRMAEETMT